jgi:hypothetical protein
MAGSDHAGIAPAGFQRNALVALKQHDLVPVLEQLIRRGHTDHPATHDQNAHRTPQAG